MLSRKLFIASIVVSIALGLGRDLWLSDHNFALVAAAQRDDVPEVSAYLDSGVRPDAIGARGMTALEWAASKGDARLVRLLLEKGADPNGGMNPAIVTWHSQIVAILVEAGADVSASQGASALCNAAQSDDIETATLLLRHGVDVNCRKRSSVDDGMTPLLCAAEAGSWRMFTFFINCGADMTARSAAGKTALMYAAEGDNTDSARICRYLVRRGADVSATDSLGKTALSYATGFGATRVAAELLQAGAWVRP